MTYTSRPAAASAEAQLLMLVAQGSTNAQIGHVLGGVSDGAVASRLTAMSKRFGTSGRNDLVARVLEVGLEFSGVPSVPVEDAQDADELTELLLTMAQMIVTDRPLGQLREVARRALAQAARSGRKAAA